MYKLFRELTAHSQSPLSSTSIFILTALTHLQTLHIFLQTLLFFAPGYQIVLSTLSKHIRFFTGGFTFDQYSQLSSLIEPLWGLFAIYLGIYVMVIVGIITMKVVFQGEINKKFIKFFALLSILHSRVIFFPIYFFLLVVLSLYTGDSGPLIPNYMKPVWFAFTLVLAFINISLALIKEFIIHQKEMTTLKTNLYNQALLIYKIIVLPLVLLNNGNKAQVQICSIINLLTSLYLFGILYRKLPFYNFTILKTCIILTSLLVSVGIIGLLQAFAKDYKIFNSAQILLIILPTLVIKATLLGFKALFENILKGLCRSPEYTIHFCLLLKEVLHKEGSSQFTDKSFFPNIHTFSGVIQGIEIDKLREGDLKNKLQLSATITNRLEDCLKTHPKSKILIIFMMNIYLEDGYLNIARVTDLLRYLETLKPFIFLRSTIEHFQSQLQDLSKQQNLEDENKLKLTKFFKYKELTNSLKEKILKEISDHSEIWTSIYKREIDIMRIINKTERIDLLHKQTAKAFHENLKDFQQNFSLPILMYAVYMNNIRHVPYEAIQILKKFQSVILSSSTDNGDFDVYSDTQTIVIISLDPRKVGQILDVTGSIENVYGLRKKKVIGYNFGCLFPAALAQIYQQQVLEYSRTPSYNINKQFNTYGKSAAGDLFEMSVRFQSHAYINEELSLALLIKKTSNPKPIFIANMNGNITDCSKELEHTFRKENLHLGVFRAMQDITLELEFVNAAFNIVYSNQDTIVKAPGKSIFVPPPETYETTLRGRADSYEETISQKLTDPPSQSITSRNLLKKPDSQQVLSILKRSSRIDMPIYRAQQLCDEYMEGRRIVLNPENASPLNRGFRLRADVKVKPYIIHGDVYKIVTISDLRRDKISWDVSDDGSRSDFSDITFGDEFPQAEEMVIKEIFLKDHQKPARPSYRARRNDTKDLLADKGRQQQQQLMVKEEIDIEKQQVSQDKKTKSKTTFKQNEIIQIVDDQQSSIMGVVDKKSRVIKTLLTIASRNNLQPRLRIAIFVVYFLIVLILISSGITYSVSSSAVTEINKGVQVAYLAAQSLINIERAWQWMLFLFAQALGVTSLPAPLVVALQYYVKNNMVLLSSNFDEIKELLSSMEARDFLKEAYRKDIKIWTPMGLDYSYYEELDLFTATDLHVTKYFDMTDYTNVVQILAKDGVLTNLNNTANDYMFRANQLVFQTEDYLSSTINKNISNLRLALFGQFAALFLLVLAFLSIPFMISRAYNKMFEVLIKLNRDTIIHKIHQIKSVQFLFEEDVEVKSFIQDSLNLFADEKPTMKAKRASKIHISTHRVRVTSKGLHMRLSRLILLTFLFVPILIGLFCGLLFDSLNSFNSFLDVNNQLSVLGQASYQGNLFLSSFAYEILFAAMPTMKILNADPKTQLIENLAKFYTVNAQLQSAFLERDNVDPFIERILEDTICPYVATQSDCEIATNGGVNGLFSLNSKYYETSNYYVSLYHQNPSVAMAVTVTAGYVAAISSDLNTINEIYPFIMNYVVEKFETIVDHSRSARIVYFLMTYLATILFAIFLKGFTLRKFRDIEQTRRKMLKIIPYRFIQENRVLGFYLIRTYGAEVETIKNLL